MAAIWARACGKAQLGKTRLSAVRCPEFADDLFRWDPLALRNLLAACANRGLETCPILGIELVKFVILLYELEANLSAFREIDDILDDNATALNATVQQRHACEDTTTARGELGLRLPSAQDLLRAHTFVQLARAHSARRDAFQATAPSPTASFRNAWTP
jgi:hypothetical protein